MITHLGLGLGAGLVSALLFSVVATGSPLGVLLLYLAPLPILIVALGWHHLVGLLALAVGALAITVFLRPTAGVAFALGPAFPAWWLAYLTLLASAPSSSLSSPAEPARDVDGGSAAAARWFPAARLLLWTGLSGALVAVTSSVAIGVGDHAAYENRLSRLVAAFLRFQAGTAREAPLPTLGGIPGASLVEALVAVAPAGLAGLLSLVLALNLWGAAKVVSISGRLARPWPDLPTLRMPPAALGVFAAGAVLTLGPGFVGVAGVALLGATVLVFALQGLAFLHDVSRGRPGRGGLLMLAYLLSVFFAQVFLPILAVAGMIDTATPVRRNLLARVGRAPGGPSAPT